MNVNTQVYWKKMKKHDKYKFDYLFLGRHNYNNCFDIQEDEESDDDKTLENDKEEIANFLESDEEEVNRTKKCLFCFT